MTEDSSLGTREYGELAKEGNAMQAIINAIPNLYYIGIAVNIFFIILIFNEKIKNKPVEV